VPSNWNDYQKIKDSVPNVKRFSIDVDHPVQQMNTSLDIKMIIRNAINQRWVPDNNGKHGKKAGRGWSYYDVNFATKNGNEINIYTGELQIRLNSHDGEDLFL
jgi:hypothetical protein